MAINAATANNPTLIAVLPALSVFSKEKKLSIAALSQTLPERLDNGQAFIEV
jgi:hypothetical protein